MSVIEEKRLFDFYLYKYKLENNVNEDERMLVSKYKDELKKKSEKSFFDQFYPDCSLINYLHHGSVLIKISFELKKPYISKGEGEFHILNGRVTENPIVRDKLTGLPMVKPSTWKGHLRFAANKVKKYEESKERADMIIKRLFGSEPGDENEPAKGRLYFFPTFFDDSSKDVITPLSRKARTPEKGPISIETVPKGAKGEFYLLYLPYLQGDGFKEDEIDEDLEFLSKALKAMFYKYGFSAKKKAGFGVAEVLKKNETGGEKDLVVIPVEYEKYFSELYSN